MEIKEVLREKLMIFDLKATDKQAVILELVEKLAQEGLLSDQQAFLEAVLAREQESTTGIGMGIAIPHGKSKAVIDTAIVFGRSSQGIDYESLDGEKSHLFFLIAVPEGANNDHLKILSQLSRKLMHEEIREMLLKADAPEDVIKAFE